MLICWERQTLNVLGGVEAGTGEMTSGMMNGGLVLVKVQAGGKPTRRGGMRVGRPHGMNGQNVVGPERIGGTVVSGRLRMNVIGEPTKRLRATSRQLEGQRGIARVACLRGGWHLLAKEVG